MATIEEVRQQVIQAKQTEQQQREQVAQRKVEAEQTKSQLIEAEKKIPLPTQSRLRSGLYAGLEGRKRRKIISKIKNQIGQKKGEVERYKGELTKFEKEQLDPFGIEIGKAEQQLSDYEREQAEWQQATRFVDLKAFGIEFLPKSVQEKIKLIQEQRSIYEYRQIPTITPPTITPPTIKTPSLGESINFPAPRDLTRTQKIKEFVTTFPIKITGIVRTPSPPDAVWDLDKGVAYIPEQKLAPITSLSLVAPTIKTPTITAPSISPMDLRLDSRTPSKIISPTIKETQLRTTGSPIRMTRLTSLKSRGYIPERKPVKVKTPILFRKTRVIPQEKKIKLKDDLFFGKKKIVKKGKTKRSIWGF